MSAAACAMAKPLKILVVDDDAAMLRYVTDLLGHKGYPVRTASGGLQAVDTVQSGYSPDLVLLDLIMPDQDGIETLRQLQDIHPGLPVIILTAVTDTRRVVEAMKLGAYEYVTKPFAPADLDRMIGECIANKRSESGPCIVEEFDDVSFVATSEKMRLLYEQVKLVARTDVSVLILGESGTGKEVVSRLVHKLSNRSKKKFLKVNCAAMPDELLESELFGYEAGAFTGATTSKPGKFSLCDQGTMLLDEIGEMAPRLQAKLLQVLQDGTFERLGGRSTTRVDVRLLAATNIDVHQAMAQEKFRKDLYYRLNTFTLLIPPLRERPEDIPVLLAHYLALYAESYACSLPRPSAALLDACRTYPWPGNVRELCNFVKRMLMLGNEAAMIQELRERRLEPGAAVLTPIPPASVTSASDRGPTGLKSFVRNLKDGAEAEAILSALQETGWNRRKASVLLNISYRALLYKIQQYNLAERAANM